VEWEQFPAHFTQVMGIHPNHAAFRQDKYLILKMLSEENRIVPADGGPFANDAEELNSIWKEL